jgi:GT2 family glycosyltransferase
VIVVDNGSTDGSVEFVRAHHPTVRIIRNDSNLGFARANNQGAHAARGRYLALLNNDTRIRPDWLGSMCRFLDEAGPETVCAASRLVSWDGSTTDFAGGAMGFTGVGFQLDQGVAVSERDRAPYPNECLFASGAAMVIEREAFLDVGSFDEDYFNYYEDVDLGWRLWLLGYRVAFRPDDPVYHRRNASISARHRTVYLLERNALFSMIKNYEQESLDRLLSAALLLTYARAAVRCGVDPAEFRPSGPERRRWLRGSSAQDSERASVRKEGLAAVSAVSDLVDHLPTLMRKRAAVQARRKRADREIAPLFRTPLRAGSWPSRPETPESRILEELGVAAYFDSLLEVPASVPGR